MISDSIKKGFSFGMASGVITTLGLMVGLDSGTHSKLVVLGGILSIAVADAFSDALGVHISEESENKHRVREIWQSTGMTFVAKFVVAATFVVPILLLSLPIAIAVSIVWGLCLLGILSYVVAKAEKINPWEAVLEHVVIGLVVIAITHLVGDWTASVFR